MPPHEADNKFTAKHSEEEFILNVKDIPAVDPNWKYDFAWPYLIYLVSSHILGLVGLVVGLMGLKWQSYLFTFIVFQIGQFGFAAGNHRYFSHRAFKAKFPTYLFLLVTSTLSFTGSTLSWSRDHRLHHKYSDTEADPYNSNRGLVYCHLGWLSNRKSELLKKVGKGIDVSDILSDPIQAFQHKYYFVFMPILTFILPTIIPMYFWNESFIGSFLFVTMFRVCVNLNVSMLVNSVAHRTGNKPYDKNMNPTDNKLVCLLAMGETFHNYHHVFPYDYRSSEYPNYIFSMTNVYLDFLIKIGQIYDVKTASPSLIDKRANRTGDGSRIKQIVQ